MKPGTPEYRSLHRWVEQQKGKAALCVDCGFKGKCHWANISGEYLREVGDYKSLCPKCHVRFDNNTRKGLKWSAESKAKLSATMSGRTPWNKGKPWSPEMRKKLSEQHADVNGANNPRWRGGTSAGYKLKVRSLT